MITKNQSNHRYEHNNYSKTGSYGIHPGLTLNLSSRLKENIDIFLRDTVCILNVIVQETTQLNNMILQAVYSVH